MSAARTDFDSISPRQSDAPLRTTDLATRLKTRNITISPRIGWTMDVSR